MGRDQSRRAWAALCDSLPGRSACLPAPTALYVSPGLGFPANLNYPVLQGAIACLCCPRLLSPPGSPGRLIGEWGEGRWGVGIAPDLAHLEGQVPRPRTRSPVAVVVILVVAAQGRQAP